jgi:hypothetical protein
MKRSLRYVIVLVFIVCWFALGGDTQRKTEAARRGEAVTFSKQVVRLMQQHCMRCHHDGGHAPFPLTTFAEAYRYAKAVKSAVVARRMPHGVNGTRLENGCGDVDTFEGPRRLLESEIATIVEWVDTDMPEGDRRDLPPPMTFDDDSDGHDDPTSLYNGWRAGEPDLKIDNGPNGFNVPARLNKDFFRRFPIKTNYEADRFFTTFEAQVGTGDLGRQINVVHHVTLFIDPTCGSLEQEKAFAASNPEIPGAGFEGEMPYAPSLVGMWFPGANPIMLQEGIGIRVPKGACLIMEVHYTTWQDVVVPDKTAIGLRWVRTPVYKERISARVNNENFVIPAGAKHHEVTATKTINEDFTIYSMAPHMHQFGVDIITEALLPNGQKKCLIDVEYDFKHQANYLLKQPITLPAGTTLKVRAFYDNTEDFPRQLNYPPIDIPFGPVSDKEMCQNVIGLTYDNNLLHPSSPTISAIRVNEDSLIITGRDLRPGASIEINGKLLNDTQLGVRRDYVVSYAEWQEASAEKVDCCCAEQAGAAKTGAAKTAVANPLTDWLQPAVIQLPSLTASCEANPNARRTTAGGTPIRLQNLMAGCSCSNKPQNERKPLRIAIVNADGGRSVTRPFFPRETSEGPSRVPR